MITVVDQEKINAGKKYWETVLIDKPYNELRLPKQLEDWHSITAHTPRVFTVIVNRPVKICGFLNITARPNPMSPIEVRIAEMVIGYLYLPGNLTHTVHLPVGKYEISLKSNGNIDYQHSYILFTENKNYAKP